MGNNYEENCVRLNELSEGDEFIGKWSPMVTKYLKNLGDDRHLLMDIETGKEWIFPHGRFPSFKKINSPELDSTRKSLEKPDLNSWKYYSKNLSLSKEIYLKMFGEPTTHSEWANSFNKIKEINELIINHKR